VTIEPLLERATMTLQAGLIAEAEACYAAVLRVSAEEARAWRGLAEVETRRGRHQRASDRLRVALALSPGAAGCYLRLAALQPSQGEAAYRRAAVVEPMLAEAHRALALEALRRGWTTALPHLRRAIAAAPGVAAMLSDMSGVLGAGNQLEAASIWARRCLVVAPDLPDGLNNLGNIVMAAENWIAAKWLYRRSLAVDPSQGRVAYNLGNLLGWEDMGGDGEAWLDRAIALMPGYAEAFWNRAHIRLKNGRLEAGWQDYEWRWRVPGGHRPRPFPQPVWDGKPLKDSRLLVWGEQGLGDEIIFLEMLPDLVRLGQSVILECDRRLVPLVARSMPRVEVVARCDPPDVRLLTSDIGAQTAIGSLCRWMRRAIGDFPRHPYLVADPARGEFWRRRLDELGPGPKVGVAWRTRGRDHISRRGSTRLEEWEPIFRLAGLHFVRLQYDECSEELATARSRLGADVADFTEIDLFNDIDDSFALVSQLDEQRRLDHRWRAGTGQFRSDRPGRLLPSGTRQLPLVRAVALLSPSLRRRLVEADRSRCRSSPPTLR
jgi:tetratricopeptide (TPR) repeat protein